MQKILQKVLLKQMLRELDSIESSYFELTNYFPELKNKEFRDDLNKHQCNFVKLYWNNLANYGKEKAVTTIETKLDMNIDDLYLPLCTTHQLKLRGIDKIGHLVQFRDSEILSLPNIGKGRLKEIIDQLEKMGLRLGMTDKDGIDFSGYTATIRG